MPTKPKTHRPAHLLSKQERQRLHDHERDKQPWRKWYKGKRWQKSRLVFLAQNPLCDECQAEGRLTPATVVDHDKPHRGDYELFWDVGNWKPKCKYHHDRKTGRGQ